MPGDRKPVRLQVRVSERVAADLRYEAELRGVSIAEILRDAISEYLMLRIQMRGQPAARVGPARTGYGEEV